MPEDAPENQAISELVKLAYDDLKSLFGKAASFATFSKNLQRYLESETRRLSTSRTFLHRSAPVDFYDIFEPPSLYKAGRHKCETSSTIFFLKKNEKLVICGEAGSGKSTLLKHIFLSSVREKEKVPVFVELRNLKDFAPSAGWKPQGFIEYIERLLRQSHIRDTQLEDPFAKLAETGRLILLFDGLDELDFALRSNFMHFIVAVESAYPSINIIVSSRPFSGADMLPNLTACVVMPFSNTQIQSFIRRQGLPVQMQLKIISSIKETKTAHLRTFLKNPLLLSLYILTFSTYASIPDKRSTFYRRVVDTLYSEHDSLSKLGYDRPKKSKLNQEQFEILVGKFSIITYFESKFAFQKKDTEEVFSKIKSSDPTLTFSTMDLVEDLVSAIGLWAEDSGIFQFCHRSIQEFFAVCTLAKLKSSHKEVLYNRMRTTGLEDYNIESAGFLTLCEELDELCFLKFLKIPLLEALISAGDDDSATKAVFGKLAKKVVIGIVENSSDQGPPGIVTTSTYEVLAESLLGCNVDKFMSRGVHSKKFINYLMSESCYNDFDSGEQEKAVENYVARNGGGKIHKIDFSKQENNVEMFALLEELVGNDAREYTKTTTALYHKTKERLTALEASQESLITLIS